MRYIDELACRDRDTSDPANGELNERLYALQDGNWNVTAIANPAGDVQERFAYSPYGVPTVLDADFDPESGSAFAWETTYASYRYDPPTGLYAIRNRVYHPIVGTWVQRDPIGYEGGDANWYRYVGSAPLFWVDPLGLQNCERRAIRTDLDINVQLPSWLCAATRAIGLKDFKVKFDGGWKRCDECCAATNHVITRTAHSLDVGVVFVFSGDPVNAGLFSWGLYGRLTLSGSISAANGKCTGGAGGGCVTLGGELGLIAKAHAFDYVSVGARGGIKGGVTVCACCSEEGCGITLKACAGGRGRAWAKADIRIWPFDRRQWEVFYEVNIDKWCTPTFNIVGQCGEHGADGVGLE